MGLLTDIRQFAVAVLRHWQALVTGGLVIAVVALYDAGGGKIDRSYYLMLFLAFIPISCFLAWRDQARLARQLDDRRAQQDKADEYAPLLQRGRKIMVKWVDASKGRPPQITFGDPTPEQAEIERRWEENLAQQRKTAFDWLDEVRGHLDADFGQGVSVRFNLGKPDTIALGLSEPEEHQARVMFLDGLIGEMRDGRLPLRVHSGISARPA